MKTLHESNDSKRLKFKLISSTREIDCGHYNAALQFNEIIFKIFKIYHPSRM